MKKAKKKTTAKAKKPRNKAYVPKVPKSAQLDKDRNHTLATLSKALAVFMPRDEGVFLEVFGKKHFVCWSEDSDEIKIQGARDFEGFYDGLRMKKRSQEGEDAEGLSIIGTSGSSTGDSGVPQGEDQEAQGRDGDPRGFEPK